MGMGATIRQARNERGLTQAALGKTLRVTPKAVAQWESEATSPKAERLPEIERALGLHVFRLAFDIYGADPTDPGEYAITRGPEQPPSYTGALQPGITPLDDTDYATIGRFDARLAAGPGSLMDPDPEPLGYHLVELQWLRSVTNAAPQHLAIVMVDGDSMEPTLSDRDWVLLDTTQRSLWKHAIFALRLGANVIVKRVQPIVSAGMIRLHSDNTMYDPEDVTEDQVAPIGRVVSIVARKL